MIRRDLNRPPSQGRLVRTTYGGAVPAGSWPPELGLAQRKHLHKARKDAVGRAAAALARHLRGRTDLRVVTNRLQVEAEPAGESGIERLVLGTDGEAAGAQLAPSRQLPEVFVAVAGGGV